MLTPSRAPLYVVTAFVGGAAVMVVEIAAGRVLAPIMGVSLYSWTAIIGLVLAGLAVGSWVGGWLSDRVAPERVLVGGAGLGAIGGFATIVLADWAPTVTVIPTTDVIGRTIWIAGCVLALPSLGLGTIVPAAVRLVARDPAATGRAVGAVYAASTLGSILGVYLTGFVLVDAIGSRASIALAGVAVLLTVLVVARAWTSWPGRALLAAALAALVIVPLGRASLAGPCTLESAYFCIQIVEEQYIGGRMSRSVKLDRLTHGSIYVDDPTFLDYGYLRVMADLTDVLIPDSAQMQTLLIGGGSYTLPRYVESRYPDAGVEVIEIDPRVTRVASAFLGLRPDTRIVSHNVDARQFFLAADPRGRYDVIYGDAFNDLSIPYHLTTREFAAMVRRAMKDDGVYLANVIDLYDTGRFLRSFMATLATELPNVYLVVDLATYELIGPTAPPGDAFRDRRRTFVVAASSSRLDFSRLDAVSRGSALLIDQAQVERYLADPRTIILTDDHAPVDKLVSPIFLARPF